MKLECLNNISDTKWDEAISGFDTKYLFHQSNWLNFLKESNNSEILRCKMEDDGRVVGYFVAIVVKRGIFRILGSPLPGSTTDYMGPIVNRDDFDLFSFLKVLDELCRNLKIHHVELCGPDILNHQAMVRNKFNFNLKGSYVIPLDADADRLWKGLNCKFRNKVRKAIKSGVTVEEVRDASEIASFIEEYYRQLKDVFKKQGLVPIYSIDRLVGLYRNLTNGSIISLRAKYNGRTIATGIFPYDDKRIYFFGGASLGGDNYLCPNDLIHWDVMRHASKSGITEYDTCGGGSFKKKFGYPFMPYYRYYKSYSCFAKVGREAYRFKFNFLQKIKGGLNWRENH
jgi:hypothetical protein